jgi:allantoate deiminase
MGGTLSERAADVIRWCRTLADCSEEPLVTTRTFLSAPMRDVHASLSEWMRRIGMDVHVDAAGNLRGVYRGGERSASVGRLTIGSHLDTVPRAGAFDGILGVVLAVALVEQADGRRYPFTIEIVGFSDEEGTRFGAPFIGSRAFAGTIDEALLERKDARGQSVRDAIREYGLDPNGIAAAAAPADCVGYLEFHIEQGPILDSIDLPLAVVDSIAGQTRCDVIFDGQANHAGTTPMHDRRDALAGAAELILTVERAANEMPQLVATVGHVVAEPGATNVIPGRCRMSLDVRHPDDSVRRRAVRRLAAVAREIAARRRLQVAIEPRLDQPAVPMDPQMTAQLAAAVEGSALPLHRMSSGAGHDAMIVASRMPAAMLFVRSPGGISHHPDEAVRADDVAAALRVGAAFLDSFTHA